MKAVEAKVEEQEDAMDDILHQLITVQKRVDEQEKTIERQGKAIQTLEMQVTRALDVIGETNDQLKRTVELLSTFPGKFNFQFFCWVLNFFNQPDHQKEAISRVVRDLSNTAGPGKCNFQFYAGY
jgi:hypothetical protein